MTPALRTMPELTATKIRGKWYIALPDGTELIASSADQVYRLVARHAPGSAIRFEGTGR